MLDGLGLHEEVNWDLIVAGLLEDWECCLVDVLVIDEQEVAEVGQAPPVELNVPLSVQLPVRFDYLLAQVGRALVRPVLQEFTRGRAGRADAEVEWAEHDLQEVVVGPVSIH